MRAETVIRVEAGVERVASVLFGAASAYAAYAWLALSAAQPARALGAALAGACGYFVSLRAQGAVQPQSRRFAVPVFDPGEVEPEELEELVLTDADRVGAPSAARHEDPLVLDDILVELAPDSRVVRLFDRAAMPTPGQLKARIDRHFDEGSPPSAAADASQALHEALAQLRRSLR
ncbi:MAG TPA: hypothetical protein VIV07_07840 [Sphingomicrobium sp.]